jgi:hypothetical protein
MKIFLTRVILVGAFYENISKSDILLSTLSFIEFEGGLYLKSKVLRMSLMELDKFSMVPLKFVF